MLLVPVGSNTFGGFEPSTTARPNTAQGTSVTPAVGSKGSYAQLIASTAADSYGMLVCVNTNSGSAASRNTVVDIALGAASSEIVLIPNLIGGNAATYILGAIWYYFPIYVPAGSRVSARAQGSVTTAIRVYAQLLEQPLNPSMIRKASFVEAIGVTPPSGVSVTAGTTSDGSWTLIGTTATRLWWWQFGVQVNTADTAHISGVAHVDIAVGDGTTFVPFIQEAQFLTTTAEAGNNPPLSAGVEYPVAAGSSIYARMQSSGTPDPYNLAVYGAGG